MIETRHSENEPWLLTRAGKDGRCADSVGIRGIDDAWRAALSGLPVGVNCQSGDPFQSNQQANTIGKLRALEASRHRGAVALMTKCVIPESIIHTIAELTLDIFVFYSITGLRESTIDSQEDILQSYLETCRRLPQGRVAIVIRPVIPGKNDDLRMLTPILDGSQQGQGVIVARGFRDHKWQLVCNQDFMRILRHKADSRGLRMFNRTACLVAAMHGTDCRLHGNVIDESGLSLAIAVGYDAVPGIDQVTLSRHITLMDSGLGSLSMGDVHFVQLLTGVRTYCDNPSQSNQLAHLDGPDGALLDCSSSWFTYAHRVPCEVGCFYCQDTYRPRHWGEVGCVPIALLECLPSSARGS